MRQRRNLGLLLGVFFCWGFVAASNSVLIGFSKTHFQLSQEQAQLLDTAFYGAYFYGALLIYLYSYYTRRDIIYVWGYKRALMLGLAISGLGMLGLFAVMAANNPEFMAILGSFFIIALGFSLQQLVANPLLLLLGSPERSAYRLSMAGGLNSLGTLIGPLVLGKLLFTQANQGEQAWSYLGYVYLVLAVWFLLLMLALTSLQLPAQLQAHSLAQPQSPEPPHSPAQAHSPALSLLMLIMALIVPWIMFTDRLLALIPLSRLTFYTALLLSFPALLSFGLWRARVRPETWGLFADKTVPLGMLAIFCYVGAEVSIPSNFNVFFSRENWQGEVDMRWDFVEISKSAIAWYWGSLMIGRWIGIVEILPIAHTYLRYFSYLLIVTLGFGVLYLAHSLSFASALAQGRIFQSSWGYLLLVWGFASLAFWLRKQVTGLLLALVITAIVCLLFGIWAQGLWGFYALVGVGLSCAMMWPAIFDLVLRGQKMQDTAKISALLIMMILGGALFSPLQGVIADISGFIRISYIIPLAALGYLLIFALYCLHRR